MDSLCLGNNVEHQRPLSATLNATSPLHGAHNLAKKWSASNQRGAIGTVHWEPGRAVQDENNTVHEW